MPVKPIAREQLIIVRDKDPKTKDSFRVPSISNDKIEEELDQLETLMRVSENTVSLSISVKTI